MQREEATVAIGPYRIRLIQRPAQVPPSPPPDGPAPDAHSQPHPPPQHPTRPHGPGCPDQPQPELVPDASRVSEGRPFSPKSASPAAAAAAIAAAADAPAAPPLQLSDCLLGWELWPAAWRLAAHLASPPGVELLRGASAVVELGAGLGLPGIVAARAGAGSVTLTDLPQALPLLAANVELNGVGSVCRTAVLDWAQFADAAASEAGPSANGGGGGGAEPHVGAYDVVLAADVVYVSSLVPLLADTIAAVCRRRRGGAVALVGHTTRKSVWLDRAMGEVQTDPTDEPWEAFQERMTRLHGFSCTRVAGDGAGAGGAPTRDVEDAEAAAALADTFVCAFARPSE